MVQSGAGQEELRPYSSGVRILPDFYALLDLPQHASEAEILDAYRKGAKKAHPDTGGSHEQFLRLGVAKRILCDASERRRYDAVLDLESALRDVASIDTIRGALKRVQSVLVGWRCPIEISGEVAKVAELAIRRLAEAPPAEPHGSYDRQHWSAASNSAGSYAPEADDTLRDWNIWHRDTVSEAMQEWPTIVQGLRMRNTKAEVRHLLYRGYQIYSLLRRAQSMSGYGPTASSDDLRHCFHVSTALVEVTQVLKATAHEFDLTYSFKPDSWLAQQVTRVGIALQQRGLVAGPAPWAESTEQPATHRNEAGSAWSRSSRSSDAGSSGPASGRGPGDPATSARTAGVQPAHPEDASAGGSVATALGCLVGVVVVGVLIFLGLTFVRWALRDEHEPNQLAFAASIKDTSVSCSSTKPIEENAKSIGFTIKCELLDARPGNTDRPYVELWANGCDRYRLDGEDIGDAVFLWKFLVPCEASITKIAWRICQTRGGPLPDDCTWGTKEP